ncbi:hypothetical protein F4824DRAFT_508032 [Ustulina deusta]|nr:hypothetical protein F4824DRAFT_508032 [Ustulina deusta]
MVSGVLSVLLFSLTAPVDVLASVLGLRGMTPFRLQPDYDIATSKNRAISTATPFLFPESWLLNYGHASTASTPGSSVPASIRNQGSQRRVAEDSSLRMIPTRNPCQFLEKSHQAWPSVCWRKTHEHSMQTHADPCNIFMSKGKCE